MTPPRSRSADQRYYGVKIGLVRAVDDPLGEGRVKLAFPWFDPNLVSEWCRVCQLYAGDGYGSLWVPEVDDEVLVAFLDGDMREPMVLGGLYNGKDKPPAPRSTGVDKKLFRTKAGHRVVFDDLGGTVTVETSSGLASIVLDDNAGKITLKGSTIEIAATGDVTVSGAMVRLN